MEQIYLSGSDNPWRIEPTPVPELSDEKVSLIGEAAMAEFGRLSQRGLSMSAQDAYQFGKDMKAEYVSLVNQEAAEAAERMSLRINDVLMEADFKNQVSLFFDYISRYPAGFIRLKRVSEVVPKVTKDKEGRHTVIAEERTKWALQAINPIDVFPCPGARSVDEGELIIISKIDKSELAMMRAGNVPGYSMEDLDQILTRETQSYASDEISDEYPEAKLYSELRNSPNILLAIEFWGNVPGRAINEWNMLENGVDIEDNRYYAIHAMVVGNNVIYCDINNNIKNTRFVYSNSYSRDPDSIWGQGIAELIKSPQNGINVSRRSRQNNIQIASGPQVIIDKDAIINLLPDGSRDLKIIPWKAWLVDNKRDYGGVKPVEFYQPTMNTAALLSEQAAYANEADELSGVPRYMQGSAQGATIGAAGTASGLKMLMDMQNTTFKKALVNIDNGFLERLLEDLYYTMMLDPAVPEDCKGDFKVYARGASGMSNKDYKDQCRLQFLNMVLSNQTVFNMVKEDGVLDLLKNVAKAYDLSTTKLFPSPSELAERQLEQNSTEQVVINLIKNAVQQGIISEEQAMAMINGGGAARPPAESGQQKEIQMQTPRVPQVQEV